MTYENRFDGRKFEETRPMEASVGVVKNAIGSARFKIGKTEAIAAVYGPKEVFPRMLKNPEKGILRCYYNMLPFAGFGGRVRPGGSRRSKEISMVTEHALSPVLDLSDYPNSAVEVYIELPQTDAGSRCAGICAASMALADAGFKMKDLVSAIAIGYVGDKVVVDLDYMEEHYNEFKDENAPKGGETDLPYAYIPAEDKFSLMQMDGEISPEDLKATMDMAKKACLNIYEVQKQALRQKFKKIEE